MGKRENKRNPQLLQLENHNVENTQPKLPIEAKHSCLFTVLYTPAKCGWAQSVRNTRGLALLLAIMLPHPAPFIAAQEPPVGVHSCVCPKASPVQAACDAAVAPVVPGARRPRQLLLQRPREGAGAGGEASSRGGVPLLAGCSVVAAAEAAQCKLLLQRLLLLQRRQLLLPRRRAELVPVLLRLGRHRLQFAQGSSGMHGHARQTE